MRRLIPLLLALALAGCGGDDDATDGAGEDRAAFEQLVQRADAELQALASSNPSSPAELAEQAQASAHELEEVAEQLPDRAPADAEAEAEQLAEELRALAAELRLAENPEEALADPGLVQRVLDTAARVQESIAALEERGFDVRSEG